MMNTKNRLIDRRTALKAIGATSLGACLCGGCRTAPVTQRRQLLLVPESQELALGSEAFRETLATEKVSQNTRLTEMVKRVGQRIAAVSNRNDYQWQFELIASQNQNAFALPGGKVAIYEGILPVCQDEAGLAVVMSHEVAHALARHGGERMSQNIAVDNVKLVAEKLIGAYAGDRKDILLQAYGVGSQYGVLLPFSRRQESEADHIGLQLMAEAGYDPTVAPEFWGRFGSLKSGEQQHEFLSTHPSDDRRAADLFNLMEESLKIYANAKQKYGHGEAII